MRIVSVTHCAEYYGSWKTTILSFVYGHTGSGDHMRLSRPKFKLSRRFLIVIGCIAFLIFVAYMWGFQTVLAVELRYRARQVRIFNLTPKDLSSLEADTRPGTRLLPPGFRFEVPWKDFDKGKSKLYPHIAVFAFDSGHAIYFFGSSAGDTTLLAEVEKDFGDSKGALSMLFGPEATKSDYDFQRTFLWTTPSEIRPWTDRRQAVRISFLLLIKAISSVGGETGVFAIYGNGWKGFQFDDPAKGQRRVTLELYDPQGRHVEIIFALKHDSPVRITQAAINRVLQTLHTDNHGAGILAQPEAER
jgi:hypothetical protein